MERHRRPEPDDRDTSADFCPGARPGRHADPETVAAWAEEVARAGIARMAELGRNVREEQDRRYVELIHAARAAADQRAGNLRRS
jgi:hypothetical protein